MALKYQNLKLQSMRNCDDDINKYHKGKAEFLKEINMKSIKKITVTLFTRNCCNSMCNKLTSYKTPNSKIKGKSYFPLIFEFYTFQDHLSINHYP